MEELRSFDSLKTLDELTGALNSELNRTALSFVRIGYLLKTIRDTDALKDTQYANINEYALDKFGLDKSQVSRFVNINDKFSIGGYSEHLKTEYEGYGQAKLALMLTLPDEINAELSPEYSKSDIQAIKDEYDAEQKITPLEVMTEPAPDQPETDNNEFMALVIKQLNDEHPDPVGIIHEIRKTAPVSSDDVKDAYRPDGDRAYNIRISGQGRFVVSAKESRITIVNLRTNEHSAIDWDEFMDYVLEDEETRTFTETPAKNEEKPKSTGRVEKSETQRKAETKMPENDKIEPKNDENPDNLTGNDQNLTEEIEKVEGEVVDAAGQRIDNVPQDDFINPPTMEDGQEAAESCQKAADEETDAAAGETASPEDDKATEKSDEAAGENVNDLDECMMIEKLLDLVSVTNCRIIRDHVEEMEEFRRYRDSLDMVSEWIAQLHTVTNNLYAKLASRNM